jgi:hypothetical protein
LQVLHLQFHVQHQFSERKEVYFHEDFYNLANYSSFFSTWMTCNYEKFHLEAIPWPTAIIKASEEPEEKAVPSLIFSLI